MAAVSRSQGLQPGDSWDNPCTCHAQKWSPPPGTPQRVCLRLFLCSFAKFCRAQRVAEKWAPTEGRRGPRLAGGPTPQVPQLAGRGQVL